MMQTKGSKMARREALVLLGKYGTIIWLLVMIAVFSILLPAFRSAKQRDEPSWSDIHSLHYGGRHDLLPQNGGF